MSSLSSLWQILVHRCLALLAGVGPWAMAKPDFYVGWQRAGLTGGYGKALWMETRLARSRSSRAWPWLSLSRQLEFSESVWLLVQGREQTSGSTRPTDSSCTQRSSLGTFVDIPETAPVTCPASAPPATSGCSKDLPRACKLFWWQPCLA